MLVAIDSDVLSLLLNPDTEPPNDPATGKPVERATERLEYLVAELEKQKTRIIVPTPALSEMLVIANESGPDYLEILDGHAVLRVMPFDQRAAIEAAATTRQALAQGDKKSGSERKWQCVKTDRQIVAVARTLGAVRIYSNDGDMRNIAATCGIEVVHVADLPLPPPSQPALPELMLDPEAETKAEASASETEQPAGQSPGAGQVKDSQTSPAPPVSPQVVPERQQQGSSPDAQPPPPSKK